jgi:putative ABC transport system substrate-binding protein
MAARSKRQSERMPSHGCDAAQIVAPSMGVELSPVDVRKTDEIERAVTAFARGSNGGLVVTGSAMAVVHRHTVAALAERLRLPTVCTDRGSFIAGGLISYVAKSE